MFHLRLQILLPLIKHHNVHSCVSLYLIVSHRPRKVDRTIGRRKEERGGALALKLHNNILYLRKITSTS